MTKPVTITPMANYSVVLHKYADTECEVSFNSPSTTDEVLDKVSEFVLDELVNLTPSRMYDLLDPYSVSIHPAPTDWEDYD